jgi:uncharacterized protein
LLASGPQHGDLVRNVVEFCRLLRVHGLRVTPSETMDALSALVVVDLSDREEFRLALRATLTKGHDEYEVFGELFESFWGPSSAEGEEGDEQDPETGEQEQPESSGSSEVDQAVVQMLGQLGSDETDQVEEQEEAVYSPLESLSEKDFGDFMPAEEAELTRAIVQIARRLATRRSRRMVRSKSGGAVDPRRSLRRSLKYGGTVLELEHRRRRISKPWLVLLCDVSRSMDHYSRFLLQFIYAFQHVFGRVEAFVFSTRLTRVTGFFHTNNIFTAVERISREVPDWSGGTRIGESIEAFNADFALAFPDNRTVTVILSDGLDTGDTDLLEKEMETLRRKSRLVIWLNPLLGDPEYRPLARGMSAALEHVDVFAPSHNLLSLQRFVEFLEVR